MTKDLEGTKEEQQQNEFSLKGDLKKSVKKKKTDSSYVQNLNLGKNGDELVASIKKTQIDASDELFAYKNLLKKRKKKLAIRLMVFAILIILLPFFIFVGSMIVDKNGRHNFFGYTFFIIVSESMQPEIMVNDCVILKKVNSADELQIGDDIGYIDSSSGKVVVHRIIGIDTTAGGVKYTTKGINMATSDTIPVTFDAIVGKRVTTARAFGNVVVFFRSTAGLIVFAVIFLIVVAAFYISFRFTENITYIDGANREVN